jgi:hypothetical protein
MQWITLPGATSQISSFWKKHHETTKQRRELTKWSVTPFKDSAEEQRKSESAGYNPRHIDTHMQ